MRKRIVRTSNINPGDRKRTARETILPDLNFHIHKLTNRQRPDPKNVVIFPMFAEFGSELLAPLYCIPKLLHKKYQGKYSIVMGWHGREYLYRHLVDEFWELDEAHQDLREYCRAFHHESKNLKNAEKNATQFGKVIDIGEVSNTAVFPLVPNCYVLRNGRPCGGKIIHFRDEQYCSVCGFRLPDPGIYVDPKSAKKEAVWLPDPSPEKIEQAKEFVGEKAVGVTARGRKCYGRNLTSEFYERLIYLLEDMGYQPIWMGEKATILPCPCPRIKDFSQDSRSRDLEFTLAVVAQMKFTIQFWTASTRLAGLVGTPFILFESPDQIWGNGQEGYRLGLCTKGDKKKLVMAHFRSVLENQSKALRSLPEIISEVEHDDFSTRIGLVKNEAFVRWMIESNKKRVGIE